MRKLSHAGAAQGQDLLSLRTHKPESEGLPVRHTAEGTQDCPLLGLTLPLPRRGQGKLCTLSFFLSSPEEALGSHQPGTGLAPGMEGQLLPCRLSDP